MSQERTVRAMTEWRRSEKISNGYWEPTAVGQSVTGVLLGVRTAVSKAGKNYGLVDLRQEGDKGDVTLFQSGLGLQWDDLRPAPGDMIRVTYTGDREWQGRIYKNFLLEVASGPVARPNAGRDLAQTVADDDALPF